MKLNKVIVILLISAVALSSKCKKDTPTTDYTISYEDEAERYAKDLDSIEHFLQIHYVNDLGDLDPATYTFDSIPTGGTQTSLWDDARLSYVMTTADADHDDERIDYKVYYMKFREGTGINPTYVDSVYVKYKGIVVTGENAEQEFDRSESPIWLDLAGGTIRAFSAGTRQVKNGVFSTNSDGTLNYDDFGAVAFFAPSGVAYFAQGSGIIPTYTPIYFQLELMAVNTDVDHDQDGILTIYEDVNNNGDVTDDNTDYDIERYDSHLPNYLDADDDEVNGHLTIDEGADPNGDGNPDDAEDLDGDGIPNYLDSDSY